MPFIHYPGTMAFGSFSVKRTFLLTLYSYSHSLNNPLPHSILPLMVLVATMGKCRWTNGSD